jgi:predicted transcriptional regulator
MQSSIQLTPRAEELLQVINNAGKPLSRSELAERMGIKKLTTGDEALLSMMAVNDLIIAEKVNYASPIGYQWVYRSKE